MPRIWSNREIRRLATLFDGDVANISGWDDRDKEGRHYKEYFVKAKSYTITNYRGERGKTGREDEISLDLSANLPEGFIDKFDVCFNHTTLEHLFDVRKAVSSICSMSRDVVIFVVPFSQAQHETESFKDFWRFTPSCMRYLFKENGLEIIYEAQSPNKNSAIYLLFAGSRYPDRWKNVLPPYKPVKEAGSWIGYSLLSALTNIARKITSGGKQQND